MLLLTNDGDVANRLQHPRYQVEREYEVCVQGVPSKKDIARLRAGVVLDDGLARPVRLEVAAPVKECGNLTLDAGALAHGHRAGPAGVLDIR